MIQGLSFITESHTSYQLLDAVKDGNFDAMKAALDAGANVDGSQVLPCAPIVAATMANDAAVVNFLLEKGADPNKPATLELPCPRLEIATLLPGERPLHIAARGGSVEIVRSLLKRSRTDPNATYNRGCTPLMATCKSSHVCVEVVRLLLEAGADPALAEEETGSNPLHAVALNGHIDLVDMLYSSAPATLNSCAIVDNATPLLFACGQDHENIVSKLLSLGAMQPMPADEESDTCPLAIAACRGFVGVVRLLINEGGIRAVGGGMAMPRPLYIAVRLHRSRILRLLLTMDGEERRSEWANLNIRGVRLLHYGTGYCRPAQVSILLEAGADEAACDSQGRTPLDSIGRYLGRDGEPPMDRGKEVAVRRMLERGPAYRARSWAWPSDEEADAGGGGDGDTGGSGGGGGGGAAVLSSTPGVNSPPVIGVRIFRPKEESSSKFFVRLIGRYCAKD